MRELQTEIKVIGPCSYELEPMPAGKALAVGRRLARGLGPALAKLASLDTKKIDLNAVGEAVQLVFEGLSEDDVNAINRELAAYTTVTLEDGRRVKLSAIFDAHFQGHLDEWVEWIRASVLLNFAPLFKSLGAAVGLREAKTT